jgi:cytochrome c-type biogenesis protein CcmF
MADLGFTVLLLSFLLCFYTVAMAAGAGFGRKAYLYESARQATYGLAGLLSVASFLLIYSFLIHDFSLRYVAGYSGKAVPTFYLVLALWGGMEGSLLFWSWILSLIMAIVVWQNRARNRELMPHVIFVSAAVQLFFLGMLLFSANPFLEHPGGVIPADGRGLNPLLQTPAMALHPPSLYLGFVGCTIPFAFAMAALITRRLDESWIKSTRRWALFAWTFLTIGNLLGANWAYTELGWGGAWGWDPVENAAIMPWFPLTAYLHSVMIQERRGMLKVWNVALILLTFVMTIFGTFLTRSGMIASVHSFAQSEVGIYFLVFLGVLCMASFGLLFARLGDLRSEHKLEAILSREFMFLMNNLLFLGAMLVILVGTLFPKISELFLEKPVSIAAPWFNEVMAPIGLGILLLMGVGSLIPWRRATPASLRHQFLWPALLGVATAVALVAAGLGNPLGIAFFAICAFTTFTVVQEFWRGTRVRMKNAGEPAFAAFANLVARARRRYGGYVVHLGIVFIFFAITGGLFSAEDKHEFKRGESIEFAGWRLTYTGLKSQLDDDPLDEARSMERFEKGHWHTVRHLAVVDVYEGDEKVATLTPGRFIYRTHPQQPTTEVDTLTTATSDLYLVLQAFDRKGETATLKAYKNPLMLWMWLGGGAMMLGALVCIWPEPRRARVPRTAQVPAVAPTGLRIWPWILALGAGLAVAVAAGAAQGTPRERRGEVSRNQKVREIAQKLMCPCPTCNWVKVLGNCGCGGAEEEIARLEKEVEAGRTEEQIIQARIAKFGWKVLASPPDTGANRMAWLLPYLAIAAGGAGVVFLGIAWTRRRRREAAEQKVPDRPPSDDRYEERLDEELRRFDR